MLDSKGVLVCFHLVDVNAETDQNSGGNSTGDNHGSGGKLTHFDGDGGGLGADAGGYCQESQNSRDFTSRSY